MFGAPRSVGPIQRTSLLSSLVHRSPPVGAARKQGKVSLKEYAEQWISERDLGDRTREPYTGYFGSVNSWRCAAVTSCCQAEEADRGGDRGRR